MLRTKLRKFLSWYILKLYKNRTIKTIVLSKQLITDINVSLLSKQKKVLICYLPSALLESNSIKSTHPKYQQQLLLLKAFVDNNFAIDICDYTNIEGVEGLKDQFYDVILGQGASYEWAIKNIQHSKSVLYLTENNPEVVKIKYQERLEYFKQRHPELKSIEDKPRVGIFTQQMIQDSYYIIAMSSHFNTNSLLSLNNNIIHVNANTSLNNPTRINSSTLVENKKNFVWFGSLGLIHKGLDILIDVFKNLPDCTLNIYGISPAERALFERLKQSNTTLHPNVEVNSERFVLEVISQNSFVISLSCSEGMQTGVATCMRYGLIPIVTPESGYEPHESLIIADSYKINDVTNMIKRAIEMSDTEMINKSKLAYEFSNQEFTGNNFVQRINNFIKKAL